MNLSYFLQNKYKIHFPIKPFIKSNFSQDNNKMSNNKKDDFGSEIKPFYKLDKFPK
jgi:hypothetical protein